MIHCVFHDPLHLTIGDPGVPVTTCTRGTGSAGMQILDWSVAEGQCDDCLCFPGDLSTIRVDDQPHSREAIVPQREWAGHAKGVAGARGASGRCRLLRPLLAGQDQRFSNRSFDQNNSLGWLSAAHTVESRRRTGPWPSLSVPRIRSK